MSRRGEINRLKNLPLEERAKEQEVSMSCSVDFIIFLCGFIPGLYYWFGHSFILDYETVSPFCGFVIFTIVGVIVDFVVGHCFSSYWEGYNKVIKDANEEIQEKIKKGDGSMNDLFRLKKDYIERKIGKKTLTEEEFEWHSRHFCWGCGREQKLDPKPYIVTKERIESWRKGSIKYMKTFETSGTILICPACHARLTMSNRISAENNNIVEKINKILCTIVAIGVFLFVCVPKLNSENPEYIIALGASLFLAFVSAVFGQIILFPLARLVALPFMNKNGNAKTKWSFDEIPKIRKFMEMDLPHTR